MGYNPGFENLEAPVVTNRQVRGLMMLMNQNGEAEGSRETSNSNLSPAGSNR